MFKYGSSVILVYVQILISPVDGIIIASLRRTLGLLHFDVIYLWFPLAFDVFARNILL